MEPHLAGQCVPHRCEQLTEVALNIQYTRGGGMSTRQRPLDLKNKLKIVLIEADAKTFRITKQKIVKCFPRS